MSKTAKERSINNGKNSQIFVKRLNKYGFFAGIA